MILVERLHGMIVAVRPVVILLLPREELVTVIKMVVIRTVLIQGRLVVIAIVKIRIVMISNYKFALTPVMEIEISIVLTTVVTLIVATTLITIVKHGKHHECSKILTLLAIYFNKADNTTVTYRNNRNKDRKYGKGRHRVKPQALNP